MKKAKAKFTFIDSTKAEVLVTAKVPASLSVVVTPDEGEEYNYIIDGEVSIEYDPGLEGRLSVLDKLNSAVYYTNGEIERMKFDSPRSYVLEYKKLLSKYDVDFCVKAVFM